jgi:anti-anti-sigma factor
MRRVDVVKNTLSADGLHLDLEEKAEETIVHCSGKLTRQAAPWFRTEIRDRVIPISRGKDIALTNRVVLNLSRLSYVDSYGLGAILDLWTDGQRTSCDVEITNHAPNNTQRANTMGIGRFFYKLKQKWMSAI